MKFYSIVLKNLLLLIMQEELLLYGMDDYTRKMIPGQKVTDIQFGVDMMRN